LPGVIAAKMIAADIAFIGAIHVPRWLTEAVGAFGG
jgi:hypothetical protein